VKGKNIMHTVSTNVDFEIIQQIAEKIAHVSRKRTTSDIDPKSLLKVFDQFAKPQELGRGLYRKVFRMDEVVYKIQRKINSRQNQREWRLFQSAPPALRKLMAIPFYLSQCGNVLVMEYIPYTLRSYYQQGAILHRFNANLRNVLFKAGYDGNEIGWMMQDNHENNIRVTSDGQMKWIDYASEYPEDY